MNYNLQLALIKFFKVLGVGLGIVFWLYIVFALGQWIGFFWGIALGVVFPIAVVAAIVEYQG